MHAMGVESRSSRAVTGGSCVSLSTPNPMAQERDLGWTRHNRRVLDECFQYQHVPCSCVLPLITFFSVFSFGKTQLCILQGGSGASQI